MGPHTERVKVILGDRRVGDRGTMTHHDLATGRATVLFDGDGEPEEVPACTLQHQDPDGYCNATPPDRKWPVCARRPHDRQTAHESADFVWFDGQRARLKEPGICWAGSFPPPGLFGEVDQ